jgi:hypothetical protein
MAVLIGLALYMLAPRKKTAEEEDDIELEIKGREEAKDKRAMAQDQVKKVERAKALEEAAFYKSVLNKSAREQKGVAYLEKRERLSASWSKSGFSEADWGSSDDLDDDDDDEDDDDDNDDKDDEARWASKGGDESDDSVDRKDPDRVGPREARRVRRRFRDAARSKGGEDLTPGGFKALVRELVEDVAAADRRPGKGPDRSDDDDFDGGGGGGIGGGNHGPSAKRHELDDADLDLAFAVR